MSPCRLRVGSCPGCSAWRSAGLGFKSLDRAQPVKNERPAVGQTRSPRGVIAEAMYGGNGGSAHAPCGDGSSGRIDWSHGGVSGRREADNSYEPATESQHRGLIESRSPSAVSSWGGEPFVKGQAWQTDRPRVGPPSRWSHQGRSRSEGTHPPVRWGCRFHQPRDS